ncbi:MAG: hypothetical protein N2746_06855 [Deltaproteobacteria bacterium]|nr:hypothetical protein [Deltaproteobacteria bacterium]
MNKKKGLCSTCIRQEDCSYIKYTSEAIHFCEEFSSGCKGIDGFSTKSASNDYADEEYEGLCRNCEYKSSCNINKNGMPIWHCEEYI